MSLSPRALAVIVGLVCCMGSASASASTFLHRGTTTGNVLAAGTPIMPVSSGPATLVLSGLGSITCFGGTGSTGVATVGTSGGATVTAAGDSLTLTDCTDTLPVINFTACHLVPPLPTATITATGSTGGTVSFSGTYMRCTIANTTSACYYNAAIAAGTATNASATLTYSNVAVTHTVPPGGTDDLGGFCGSTGVFGVTFTDLTTGSPSTTVVLNQTA